MSIPSLEFSQYFSACIVQLTEKVFLFCKSKNVFRNCET